MSEILFETAEITLATIGFITVFCKIISMIFKTKQKTPIMIVLPMKGHNEEAEFLLRNVAWQSPKLSGKNKKIVCLDLGMDDETRQICNITSKDYTFIDVWSYKDLHNFFRSVGR